MPAMTYGALASTELVAQCNFEEAIAQASREIEAQPAEPEAYFNRGQAQTGLGRFSQAADDYERALSLDASASGLDPEAADDELFFALRNVALEQKDRPEEARATLERYRRVLPDGRHLDDIQKWVNHINGVEEVWVRETA
jgi:tetratricopeptide (TPR) repeat protein